MKFSKSQIGRITKATILSLAIGLGMTACSSDYTIDYLYVVTAGGTGQISSYKIDNQSGSLTQIVDSPQASGGQDPVAVVTAPDGKLLFVVNRGPSTANVVIFAIGTDGKIYPKNTYTPPSGLSYPQAAAISPDGQWLAVAYAYQPGYTSLSPNPPGALVVYKVTYLDGSTPPQPISPDGDVKSGRLETPVIMTGGLDYIPVAQNPVALGFDPQHNFLYLVEQTPGTGTIVSFGLNDTSGVLSLVSSTAAGTLPHAIAEEPTGRFVYVTDQAANQLIGYVVQSNGSLNLMVTAPFSTGLTPEGIVADPRGKYLYVTSYNSSTLNGYAIDQATGAPSGVFSNGISNTGTGPNCVTIEPAQGIYVYTSNFVDNSISGLQMDPHTGALVNVQNTPFNTTQQPTCAVAVATASGHAYQAVQP